MVSVDVKHHVYLLSTSRFGSTREKAAYRHTRPSFATSVIRKGMWDGEGEGGRGRRERIVNSLPFMFFFVGNALNDATVNI